MHLFIKSAKVVDPSSPHNGKTVNILIENGIIKAVGNSSLDTTTHVTILDINGLHVAPGFFDMQVNFRDPGHEYKEDLISGCQAAAAGGFTSVAVMPGTTPPIHSKSEVEYVKNKTKGNIVDVHPVGCISHNAEGNELSEMFDMHQAGAVAFSSDKKPIADAGLLLRALLYAKNFKGKLLVTSDDKTISLNGQMNEGKTSTSLGLKGMPALSEELMVNRNLFISEYADSPLHFQSISTEKSVAMIREAKKKGLKVTASTNICNLVLDDTALKEFDTDCKVNPPLRGKSDIAALKKGLIDGTIDVICSDHCPEDEENKKVEFDYAAFGMIGLETCFALANTHSGLKLNELVKKLAIRPREILGIKIPKIKVKEQANLTLFLPNKDWTFELKHSRSKSKNSPFIGKKMKGKIVAVVNNSQVEFSDKA